MRIALITGATSGMGKEFVTKTIKEEGSMDEIWLVARRKGRLDAWGKKFLSCQFRSVPLDLEETAAAEELAYLLKEAGAELSLFVHCAGVGMYGDIAELPLSDQQKMVNLNCRSTVEVTNAILPFLTKDARLIYMASAAAFLPQPGFSIYAASKSFVLSFVRSLRAENKKKGWKITAVCPGAVKTEFFDIATKDHPLPKYKKLVMADPKKVVEKAWKDNLRNKELSIYGLPMQGFYLATKLIPHRLFLHFLGE